MLVSCDSAFVFVCNLFETYAVAARQEVCDIMHHIPKFGGEPRSGLRVE